MADVVRINYMRVYDTYALLLAEASPGGLAWVMDASGDETVDAGAALYYWNGANWVKRYEMEVLDRPTTTMTNYLTVKKFTEQNGKLLFNNVEVARLSDVSAVVAELAPPIITQVVNYSVGQIVTNLVQDAMSSVIEDLNGAISASVSSLREEFAEADSNTLGTANENIATAKSEVLNSVIKSASNTNSIAATVNAETRDLTLAIRLSVAEGNRASVSAAGLFVAKELPSDAANNDIAVFNGTSWAKMALSSIPSTLAWTTV